MGGGFIWSSPAGPQSLNIHPVLCSRPAPPELCLSLLAGPGWRDGELTFTCPLPASSETWQRTGNPLLPEGKQSLGTALQEQEFHVLRRFSSSSANRVLSGLCCGEFPRGSAAVIAEITTSLVRSSRGCLGGVLHGGCQGCLEAFESHRTPLAGHLCCPS